ncbi:hypothetical protein E1B28_003632, partial [Marasmius oreades]
HTTINFIWDFALSKLYTNALFSTLNARRAGRSSPDDVDSHNVLFGTSFTSSTGDGEIELRRREPMHLTNPEMSFAGSSQSGALELDEVASPSPGQRRHGASTQLSQSHHLSFAAQVGIPSDGGADMGTRVLSGDPHSRTFRPSALQPAKDPD